MLPKKVFPTQSVNSKNLKLTSKKLNYPIREKEKIWYEKVKIPYFNYHLKAGWGSQVIPSGS